MSSTVRTVLDRVGPPPAGKRTVAAAEEAVVSNLSGFDILALDPKYSGSCPCASVVIDGQRIELHCWRVCFVCEYVGIHYEGAAGRVVAEHIKPALDAMDWYGEWPIVEGYRFYAREKKENEDGR